MRHGLLAAGLLALCFACSPDAQTQVDEEILVPLTPVALTDDRSRVLKLFASYYGEESQPWFEESCIEAKGEIAPAYELAGSLTREPREGAKVLSRCWLPTLPPGPIADGGKPCAGQSDCLANCLSERQSDGTYSAPTCQSSRSTPPCDAYVYEGGEYHGRGRLDCPIP